MNDTFKRYLVSSLTTFLTAFLTILAGQISAGAVDFSHVTANVVISVILVAFRAGIKAVVEKYAPISGDPVVK